MGVDIAVDHALLVLFGRDHGLNLSDWEDAMRQRQAREIVAAILPVLAWQVAVILMATALLCALLLSWPPTARGAVWSLADRPAAKSRADMPARAPATPGAQLQQRIHRLAAALRQTLEISAKGYLEEGLAVVTFVELKKLYRSSSFGRYLADQLMNEFQQAEYRVVELRKTNEVLIQQKHGEHGLSRDPDQVSSQVEVGAILTGTYTLTPEEVLVNARIVDNRDASLLASASLLFPRTAMVDYLLADGSTARTATQERIYVKRLTR